MSIKCCIPCVKPKRYPGCQDHCPEYAAEKAKDQKEKDAYRKQHAIQQGILSQKYDGVCRANRRKGKK